MFKLVKDNVHCDKLIKFLQDTNPVNRSVAYHAMAEFLVPQFIKEYGIENCKQQIKDFIWNINEMAIIDRTLLERIFNTTFEYKLFTLDPANVNKNLLESTCFQDVLGISKFYCAEDIHTINVNFNLFLQVATEVITIMNQNKEILVKNG